MVAFVKETDYIHNQHYCLERDTRIECAVMLQQIKTSLGTFSPLGIINLTHAPAVQYADGSNFPIKPSNLILKFKSLLLIICFI